MKRLKGDNRGVSLIELLIAMLVLAIVVVPFLHSFITAANTNTKAKSIHKATVLAQSVLEGFKAEGLEEIALQFNYPAQGFRLIDPARIGSGTDVGSYVAELRYSDVAGYTNALNYESPALSGEADKRDKVTASTYSEDLGVTSEFLGQNDGVYYFALQEVKEDTTFYDVLVKLDATAYRAGTGGTVEDTHRYNSTELVQLPVVDLERDAICVQKESFTESALDDFEAAYSLGVDRDTIEGAMTRTITVTLERTRVGSGDYRTKVLAEYKYIYQKDAWETQEEYVKTQTAYDSTETGKDLRSVYLYYTPLYSSGNSRDTIIFKNNAALPVDFYLMKQTGDATTSTNEDQYNLNLYLEESGATADTMNTELFTNLAENLASGGVIGTPFYKVWLNNVLIESAEIDKVIKPNMLLTDTADRVFDIEVNIYEKGAQSAGYPEDMRLTTLTGSRLN